MTDRNPTLADQFAAAIDWWRSAGVDHDYVDDATDWLAEPEEEPVHKAVEERPTGTDAALAAPPETKIDLLGENPPGDIEAFREWWLSAPEIDAGGPGGRVAPRGPIAAELMVLVMDPEAGDGEKLLSQGHGRLLANFLRAAGIDETRVYFASVLPRPTPMAEASSIELSGMGDVMRHHIALAAPKRILAFGRNILPLLGHDVAHDPASSLEFNRNGESLPLMGVVGLDSLGSVPRLKAVFWQKWLDWFDG